MVLDEVPDEVLDSALWCWCSPPPLSTNTSNNFWLGAGRGAG